jgi:hypothetical protein
MPGTIPVHIHPGGAKAHFYNRLLEQALLDSLDVYSSTRSANVSGTTLIPPVATLGPSYPYLVSAFRTDGTWPFNGMVFTQKQVDGVWAQWNIPFSGTGNGAFAMRTGTATAWGAWTYFEGGGLNLNTIPLSSFSTGMYVGLSQLGLPDALWSLQANGSNLKLADAYEDTSGLMHFRFCNDANSSCTDWMTVARSGQVSTGIGFSAAVSAPAFAGSGTATFAAGAGAGTSPGTFACVTSYICDSVGGFVQLTAVGTSPPTTGTILTVTLGGVTRSHIPSCELQAFDTSASGVPIALGVGSSTTTTVVFTLSGTALTAAHQVEFKYSCIGQ